MLIRQSSSLSMNFFKAIATHLKKVQFKKLNIHKHIARQSQSALFSLNNHRYYFSSQQSQYPQSAFIFSSQTQPQLLKLQLQYKSTKSIELFAQTIKGSTKVLDQMKIFKIFKLMETTQYDHQSYEKFFELVDKNIQKKSDNLLLLLAAVKQKQAKYFKGQSLYDQSLQRFEEALDILENSRVPPLFPYYSIYRQYGLLHHQLGQRQKSREILEESVDILDDFVSNSDDNVSSNDYCKKQATAYNALTELDYQNQVNRKKWLDKALKQWQSFQQNKFTQIEYAKTISNQYKQQLSKDKQKAEALYHFNLYKFQLKQLKDILKKAREGSNKDNLKQ